MLSLQICRDRNSWRSVLAEYGDHDFGHTYDFHVISEKNGEGRPILFDVRDDEGSPVLCWPALLRQVPGTKCFDLTSVYGYSGPLVRKVDKISDAMSMMFDAMKGHRIISLFARMHPLLINNDVSQMLGCEQIGNVVVIDVAKQRETLETYRANHRRDILKAAEEGVYTVVDADCSNMGDFIRIYSHTMRDLHAKYYYFFDETYFSGLVNAVDFNVRLILAKYGDAVIGAVLLVITNNIMHYYLGGVDRGFIRFSPLKIMLAAAHRLAIGGGVRYFVLGGGPGGMDDSLIRFKRGFSKLVYPFNIIKKVVDEEAYKEVCTMKNIDFEYDCYFPAYRAVE